MRTTPSPTFPSRLRKPAKLVLACAAPLIMAACAEQFSHRETIEFSAGDAIAANKVLQVIDPWDQRAGWTDIDQDGNRAVKAVDTYRTGETSESSDAASGDSPTQTQ